MNHENPYATPQSHIPTDAPESGAMNVWISWLRAWIGIGVSGIIFGMIGGPIGMIFGAVFAFPAALVTTTLLFPVVAILNRGGANRLVVLVASAVTGFASGVLSVMVLSGGHFEVISLIAGLVGATGGVVANVLPALRRRPAREIAREYDEFGGAWPSMTDDSPPGRSGEAQNRIVN